jgi:hypothetical protein
MDIESIEGCWRREAELLPPRLEEGTVLRMIEARAAALRRSLRGRLRREAGYYLPMMILFAATLLGGVTLGRLLAASAVVALVGAVMATLWRAERRIQEAPLDRSVRESLARLAGEVDAAGRAYAAAYVLVFLVSAAALTSFVWWRHGAGLLFVAALAGSVLAVAWSRRSGRSYVDRMFRRYRAELADCLGQLENETPR